MEKLEQVSEDPALKEEMEKEVHSTSSQVTRHNRKLILQQISKKASKNHKFWNPIGISKFPLLWIIYLMFQAVHLPT